MGNTKQEYKDICVSSMDNLNRIYIDRLLSLSLLSVIHDPLQILFTESFYLVLSSFAPLPLHFKHILLPFIIIKPNSLPLLIESKSLPADWASAVPVEVIVTTICEYCSSPTRSTLKMQTKYEQEGRHLSSHPCRQAGWQACCSEASQPGRSS